MGFKTYSDATKTIQKAATTAVADLQQRERSGKEALDQSVKQTKSQLEAYAKSPEIKQSVDNLTAHMKRAETVVDAFARSADEDQQKLTNLSAARLSNPNLTLGQLDARAISPALSGELTGVRDFATVNVFRSYRLGSSGDEVKRIQVGLRDRRCYSGEITGTFDDATSNAVIAYKQARGSATIVGSVLSPAGTPLLTSLASPPIIQYDGVVDSLLFNELDSGILYATCSTR